MRSIVKPINPLIPSLPQVLLYIGLSLLLTLLIHYQTILTWLGGDTLEAVGGYGFVADYQNYYLDYIFAVPILGTIVVGLFWAGVGSLLYCIFWGLTNTAVEVKKYEKVAQKNVMPRYYNQSRFWQSSLANIMLFLSSIFAFLIISVGILSYGKAISEQLLIKILTNTFSFDGLSSIIIFVVSSVVLWHGLYFAVHVFNYSRRIVFI